MLTRCIDTLYVIHHKVVTVVYGQVLSIKFGLLRGKERDLDGSVRGPVDGFTPSKRGGVHGMRRGNPMRELERHRLVLGRRGRRQPDCNRNHRAA